MRRVREEKGKVGIAFCVRWELLEWELGKGINGGLS